MNGFRDWIVLILRLNLKISDQISTLDSVDFWIGFWDCGISGFRDRATCQTRIPGSWDFGIAGIGFQDFRISRFRDRPTPLPRIPGFRDFGIAWIGFQDSVILGFWDFRLGLWDPTECSKPRPRRPPTAMRRRVDVSMRPG